LIMANMKPFFNLRLVKVIFLLQCSLLLSVTSKNMELNEEGYQNYMKKYEMFEDFN